MALLLVVGLLSLGMMEASAQGAGSQKTPPAGPAKVQAPAKVQPPPQPAAQSTDYMVGPQDLIRVTIYGEPQLSGTIRIDADGTFPFHYISRVKAEGLTTTQIEANLVKALGDGYLRNPHISVEVIEYRSQSVFVTGEVRAPNKYAVQGDSTLMDVLTLAGSLLPTAGSYVVITHARRPDGKPGTDIRVSLRDIQTGKAQNVRVEDGDTIFVPKAERIFVLGAVRNSGAITYEDGMTIFQAVSLAGGITEKGANRFAIRRVVKGQMKEFDARPEDVVEPGDYIVVRNRRL
jgi:polysaccharide export outer membrane protein